MQPEHEVLALDPRTGAEEVLTSTAVAVARVLGLFGRPTDDAALEGNTLGDVGRALTQSGLRCPTLELTPLAAAKVADERPLLTQRHVDAQLHWYLLSAERGGRVRLTIFVGGRVVRRRLRPGDLCRELGVGPEERLRWLAPEEAMPLARLTVTEPLPSPKKPWRRLRQLIALERRVVWVLAIYAAVTGLLALATPIAVQTLVNTIAFGTLVQPLVVIATLLLVVLTVGALLRLLQLYAVEYLERRLFVRLSMDLAVRMPRVRASVADNYRPTELVNRFFDVVTVQKSFSKLVLDGLDIALKTSLGLLLLALYHPALLVFDVLVVGGIGAVLLFLGRGATASALAESDRKYAVAAWLEEVAGAPTPFRTPAGRASAQARMQSLADGYLDERGQHFRHVLSQVIGLTSVQVLAGVGVLALGGWLVLEGSLTLGQLVAAELVVAVVISGIGKLADSLNSFYDLLAGLEKVGKLVDLPLEPVTPPAVAGLAAPRLGVEHLSFSARSAGAWTRPVSFEVPPGTKAVIVAHDHAPRNPLLEALFGLREPTSGRVVLDGLPLSAGFVGLRQRAALVRHPEWVVGPLRDNLRYVAPEASDADLYRVLDAVSLGEAVLALPDGLDTRLDPEGGPLDHDQQARLALARGLINDPDLLLVDHTFDILCPSSIEAVGRALRGYRGTALVITRHPEVARAICDHSYRLVDGQLLPLEEVRA